MQNKINDTTDDDTHGGSEREDDKVIRSASLHRGVGIEFVT